MRGKGERDEDRKQMRRERGKGEGRGDPGGAWRWPRPAETKVRLQGCAGPPTASSLFCTNTISLPSLAGARCSWVHWPCAARALQCTTLRKIKLCCIRTSVQNYAKKKFMEFLPFCVVKSGMLAICNREIGINIRHKYCMDQLSMKK